ncbi:facilitated trehalose transporter Tret1-like isoform X1 [Oratosquilla oratoria]|uniref:facilitated trehalose transporter Tret1-like isoform X1 n=1 Tax=Oratosquilla oratoria TaxID=337810 RepID=UPI003F762316
MCVCVCAVLVICIFLLQVAFAIVAAGCMLIGGNFMAWPNIFADLIVTSNNITTANVSTPSYPRLLMTDYEVGWLATLPIITCIPCMLLSGFIVQLVGLKGSVVVGVVLAIASWLLMGLTSSKTALFIGRAISGAPFAIIVTTIQPLVSELVSPNIRGVAASIPRFMSILGSLEVNVADIFLPWDYTTLFCALPFVAQLILLIFVPESPYWLVKKGQRDAAVSALKSLYPSADDVEDHFQEVKKCVSLSSEKPGVREQIHQMSQSSNYKPVILMATLFAIYGSNGYSIFVPYSTLIFGQAGMTLDPRLCTILLGVIRLVSAILGALVSDLCGRRLLYVGSSILSILSLVLTFVTLTFSFIPKIFVMISLMSFIIFSSGGINLVPPILMGEVIPSAVQSVGCSLCSVVGIIIYGCFLFITPWLTSVISLRFILLIPTAAILLGTFVAWRWLPETKSRSLLQLQKMFK